MNICAYNPGVAGGPSLPHRIGDFGYLPHVRPGGAGCKPVRFFMADR